MGRLKCPRCSKVVLVIDGVKPVCTRCGHGSDDGMPPPRPKRAAAVIGPRGPAVLVQPEPKPEPAAPPPVPEPYDPYAGLPHIPGRPVPRQAGARSAFAKPSRRVHGTRRAFLAVFLLSLVTAGLYAWYYWYVTFRDVARQTGARHAASTYFGGLLFFAVAVAAPLLLEPDRIMFAIWGLALVGAAVSWTLYWIIGFRQLHAARARKRLPRGIGLGGYLAWSIPGMFLLGLGPLIAWGKLNASFNGYWARFSR